MAKKKIGVVAIALILVAGAGSISVHLYQQQRASAEEAAKQEAEEALEAYAEAVRRGDFAGTAPEPTEQAPPAEEWYPAGFEQLTYDLARKKVGNGKYDFVSKYGCSRLYIEVNFEDASGRVIDWDNDVARNIMAGQTVQLSFSTRVSGVSKMRFTEASCY